MNITREEIIRAFKENNTDKLYLHGYDSMYCDLFSSMDQLTSLLEIGVLRGESIGAWVDLFPNAHIVGADINLSKLTNTKTQKARIVECDATMGNARDILNETFNIIIDDGSHLPVDQWVTFSIFEGRWTDFYVIEDVIGTQHVQMLCKYLRKKGYKYRVYPSKKTDAKYRMGGKDVIIEFYAVVVLPKENV